MIPSDSIEKYLVPLVVAALSVIAPIKDIMLAVGILIVGDMILGVLASRKQGIKITSARLRDTVTKMFIYHLVIVLGFVVEKFLTADMVPITKIAAGAVGLVEMVSVYENAGIILGKPVFAILIQKLGSKNRE